jgi:four helix bundle protein
MATIGRFEDIQAWQKARELVCEIYKISSKGRLDKDFALRDQLCRAAVSSMSNIAEGFSRISDKDFARFLDIARGSTLGIGYIEKEEFERLYKLADETTSLIGGFTSYLRRRIQIETPN